MTTLSKEYNKEARKLFLETDRSGFESGQGY